MKRIIIGIALATAMLCGASAQNSDLLKWANKVEGSNVKTSSKNFIKDLRYDVELKDGLFLCEGTLSFSDLSEMSIFRNALSFLSEWDAGNVRYILTDYGKELKTVDIPTSRLNKISPAERKLDFETGVVWRPAGFVANYYFIFNITLSVEGNSLSFLVHNIRRTSYQFGRKSIAKSFEQRYKKLDRLSFEKEQELSDFNKGISELINKMEAYISKNTVKEGVTHWENIKKQTICEGMTVAECIMSWGLPLERNTSWSSGIQMEQFIYTGETYVHFTDGRITSIINL